MLAKDIAKDIAKGLAKARATSPSAKATGTAAHIGVDARMAILVKGSTLFGIRQHFVGLFDLFELRLCLLGFVALVAVGVVLHREFAISLFDLVIACAFGDAEDFIKIAFGHGVGSAVFCGACLRLRRVFTFSGETRRGQLRS